MTAQIRYRRAWQRWHAGDHAGAIDDLQRMLALAPADADALNLLGLARHGAGQEPPALAALRRALRLAPDDAASHANLATMLKGADPRAAERGFRRALACAPALAEAHYGYGNLLRSAGHGSVTPYTRAVTCRPAFVEAREARAHLLLRLGHFAEGWAAYEWRWRVPGFPTERHHFRQPQWAGEPITGRTILVHSEQGLGDTIQFARYLPLLAGCGATVIFQLLGSHRPLFRLMKGLPGVKRVTVRGDSLPAFDVHVPLLGLPHRLGGDPATLASSMPYLSAPDKAVAHWRRRLADSRGLRVGLVWAGRPEHANDAARSLPLSALAPLLATPGVSWFSLQKGRAAAALAALPPGTVTDLAPDLIDFADTAAAMEALDLVISVDTAPAHLAGALGIPTWVLLAHDPDWRWQEERDDSPWYPAMRLFRQGTPGDWQAVVAAVADALRTAAPAERHRPAPSTAAAAHLRPLDPGEVFALALDHQRQGRLSEAERLYRAALRLDPNMAAAWHCLGRIALARGHLHDAEHLLGQAARRQPNLPGLARDRDALRSDVTPVPAFVDEVRAEVRAEVPAMPAGSARSLFDEGFEHQSAGRIPAAERCYRRALVLDPAYGQAVHLLGVLQRQKGLLDDGLPLLRRAVRLDPDVPVVWINLAGLLRSLDRPDATAAYRRALALGPGDAEVHNMLGTLQWAEGLFAVAEAGYRRALVLAPGHLEARANLGNALSCQGRTEAATECYRDVLAHVPGHANARFGMALALLKSGDLERGWEYYESRWETGQIPPARFPRPPWQGDDLTGRTILLHAEQGHGDTLHFVRYAPMVARRGGRVLVLVQPALKRLVAGMPDLAGVYGPGDPIPPFDVHCPLMSLPRLFGTTLDSIPAGVPYVHADPAAVRNWGERLPSHPGRLLVGLVWAGDPRPHQGGAHAIDRRRSLRLEQLAPLFAVEGVTFVSVQFGARRAELAGAAWPILDPMDAVRDFADTAALVANLDLLITVDTSMAHLAGALGRPVWVLSRFDGCWRWLSGRDDSPWYPTMRLFRQDTPGEWEPLIRSVAGTLGIEAARRQGAEATGNGPARR